MSDPLTLPSAGTGEASTAVGARSDDAGQSSASEADANKSVSSPRERPTPADALATARKIATSSGRKLSDDTRSQLKRSKVGRPLEFDELVQAFKEADFHLPSEECRCAFMGEVERLKQNAAMTSLLLQLTNCITGDDDNPPLWDTLDEADINSMQDHYSQIAEAVSSHPLYRPATHFIGSIRSEQYGEPSLWRNSRNDPHQLADCTREGILLNHIIQLGEIVSAGAAREHVRPVAQAFAEKYPHLRRLASIAPHIEPVVSVNLSDQGVEISWDLHNAAFSVPDRALVSSLLNDMLPEQRLRLSALPPSRMDLTAYSDLVRSLILTSSAGAYRRSAPAGPCKLHQYVAMGEIRTLIELKADNLSQAVEEDEQTDQGLEHADHSAERTAGSQSEASTQKRKPRPGKIDIPPFNVADALAAQLKLREMRKEGLMTPAFDFEKVLTWTVPAVKELEEMQQGGENLE